METNTNPTPKIISIINIDFRESFDQLTEEEKNYLYYLSKACWAGQLIDLFQTSYESPALFMIFQKFFGSFPDVYELEEIMKKNDIDPDIFDKFMEYAARFYSNFGNYTIKKKKFFPEFPIPPNSPGDYETNMFEKILSQSDKFGEFKSIWDIIKYIIFDKTENAENINLEEKDGKNCYYLGGIKKEQIESTDEFLLSKDISLLNTRLFLYNSKVVTLIGSINDEQIDLDDKNILLYGEYSSILKKINENLSEAQKHTTKEEEKELINDYINFFQTGKIEKHIESQKKLVQLNSQVDINYNLGWYTNEIDPLNSRGLFEGFVGFNDNFSSQKYEQIINLIPQLIQELPWPQDFNEKLGQTQFKSFEIICFARKGCPFGKSLPNYLEIKKEFGTKNLLFSNVYPNFKEIENNYDYYDPKDQKLISNFGQVVLKLTTTIKLLIGYGTGKFLKCELDPETKEEKYNFDKNLINPLTNKAIEDFYQSDETYEKKFGHNTYIIDETISTLIYLYLCENESIQEVFFVNKMHGRYVTQTCWLLFFSEVISNLNLYIEKEKTWIHTPSRAAWIIFNYILSEQKESEEIINIEYDSQKEQKEKILKLKLINQELLSDKVNEIISKLLQKLYIYKCTGNVKDAMELIDKYSVIENDKILAIKKDRENIAENKTFYLFHNLSLDNNNKVIYKEYKKSKEGIIKSNLERFGQEFDKDIYWQWVKYATNFLKNK